MRRINNSPFLFVVTNVVLCALIVFAYNQLLALIQHVFRIQIEKADVLNVNPYLKVCIACIFIPVIETYLFQKLVYDYFISRQKSRLGMIIISSILFGVIHLYNVAYAIGAAIVGVVLIYAYITWDEDRRVSKFLIVSMIHSFYNLLFLTLEACSLT